MPRLAGGLLARVVAQFKSRHPEVMVSIQSGNAGAIHDWVSSGLCDIGLALLSEDSPGVQVEPVLAMNCVAVLPLGHRLARLDSLGPEHFADEPFISFSGGTALRKRVDALFARGDVRRALIAEASLGASICAMVGAGLGVSIVNPLAASEERIQGDIVVRPFTESLPVTAALMYPPYDTRPRLVELFARYARQLILTELGHLGAPVTAMPKASV
jgi:DNA-binding transcriptional LysR family regulator